MQRIMDSGSNYNFYQHEIKADPRRSAFPLNHLHVSTFRMGALYPVYVQWTLPNSDYTISVSDVIRSMPMTVPLMSRMRVFFHFYYCTWSQLWNKAQSFIDKSASGKTNYVMPTIDLANTHNESLWRYMGLPQYQNTTIDDGHIIVPEPHDVSALKVSALPFMMYQKIYRDYYLNRNFQFNQNGEFDVGWYPDEEEDFRILGSGVSIHEITPVEGLDPISLTELRYRDYTPDYFVSALPKPQLGEPIGISLAGTLPVTFDFDYGVASGSKPLSIYSATPDQSYIGFNWDNGPYQMTEFLSSGRGYGAFNRTTGEIDYSTLAQNYTHHEVPKIQPVYVDLSNISAVTIDKLRLLNMNEIEMEKQARCDGTFGSFMRAFFGVTPNSSKDMRPVYIGGTYQPIIVSDVVQTSATQIGDNTSVQGNQTGKGFSSDENANIGHVFSDEFGLIMGIMSIMPDTYYGQGIDRQWSIQTQDDLYFPDRAGLSMQEIKLKELYASLVDEDQNNKIFAYQNRYDEWRYRQNYVTGYIGDPSQKEYFAYIQQRHFNSEPTYSQSWATTKDNIDYTAWFANVLEPPFIGQLYFDVRAVEPMPYRGIPQGLFGLSS